MLFRKNQFKDRLFAFVPDNQTSSQLHENGIAFVVLTETDNEVSGLRLLVDGNRNFESPFEDFKTLVERGVLVEVEKLPKFVITAHKKQFNVNLKNHAIS